MGVKEVIMDLLRRAARRETDARLIWRGASHYNGHVTIEIEGWSITVLMDGGDPLFIEDAVAPDGISHEFSDADDPVASMAFEDGVALRRLVLGEQSAG